MADKPQTADRSLLLDYVSPINLSVFWHAIRKRDWAVVVAVTGTFLTKLIVIVSTGLFAGVFVHRNIVMADISVLDQFDPTRLNMSGLNSRPIHRIYGVRALNMTYPPGTTAQHAFTTVDTSTCKSTCVGSLYPIVETGRPGNTSSSSRATITHRCNANTF